MTNAAIWLRVSTDEQSTANQLAPLTELAEARGYNVAEVYDASGVSAWDGSQGRYLREVYKAAHQGKFSVLLVWALDRLSREGVGPTLNIVQRLEENGCKLVSYREPEIDTTTRFGELLLSVFAYVAAMESDQRSERVKAGIARRKAAGGHVGRKRGSRNRR